MLFFGHFAPLFFVLINIKGQNNFKTSLKNISDTNFDNNLKDAEPRISTSCYVRRLNASHDFFITCPTTNSCYIQPYTNNSQRHSPPLMMCDSMDKNKALPLDKVDQLNSVLRMLKMTDNETVCDEFHFIETFQALEIQGVNLGQLGKGNCPIENHRYELNCSYHLKFLNIVDNNVEVLSDNSFCQFKQLKVLRMVNCQLRRIHQEAFVHLVNLTTLLLPNNGLTEIAEKTFQNLLSLTMIRFDGNKIKRLRKNTFKNNLQLTEVSFQGNELNEIPPIGHLYNLKQLHIQRNRIGSIMKRNLSKCNGLSALDLSYNQLSFIADGAFDGVRRLDTLDLSHNRLTARGANLINVFEVLNVNLDYNNFTAFSFDYFPRRVQQLSIRFNQIATYEDFIVRKLNLTSVDLSNNQLVSVAGIELPPTLQSLNLSSNRLQYLGEFGGIRGVKSVVRTIVDLRDNNITEVCKKDLVEYNSDSITYYYYLSRNPLKCTCENMWLKDVARGAIVPIKIQDADDLSCHLMTPSHPHGPTATGGNNTVQMLSLNNQHFLCESKHTDSTRCKCYHNYYFQCEVQSCPYNCTCLSNAKFDHLFFQCKEKNFRQFPRQFIYKNVLKSSEINFDFSGNSIAHLGPVDFGTLNALIFTLTLSSSKIQSIEPQAFDGLLWLESLNLRYNCLENLPVGLFHNLTRLIFLDLSNNRLKYLADDAFISNNNLSNLFLHNNSLKRMELQQIADLKSLKNVTLHKNIWSCECAFILSFKTFLINSSISIDHKLELECTEEEKTGEKLKIPNFNTDHCSKQIHLTIIILSLTSGLVLIITSGLMFKWRYELRVLVHAHYGIRFFSRRQPEAEVERMQYDAFVAYNKDDFSFLFNDLLPGLEAIAQPYRLCIDQRDFPPGAVNVDCLMEAMDISSRTIILLSENFVHCGWCQFVFKTAHMTMLQERCPRVLVILVGEVPETLDPEMKMYLETNTYLKWEEKLFWQKLYFAMPDKRVTSPATDLMPMKEL